MSTAIFEEAKKDIDEAYRMENISKLEKETIFIINQLIISMMGSFKDQVKSITIDTVDFKKSHIFAEENRKNLSKWLDRLQQWTYPISDLEFGKLKVDFESWYYELGGKDIHFEYQEDYLITPAQAAERLGISKVTLNKYIKQGLECVNTTNHHKIPKHAIELWMDPIYAIKMQMLAQEKTLQNQSLEERIQEVNEELLEFQKIYKEKNVSEAFSAYDIDAIDDPSDYYDWRDLEEEKEQLLDKLIEGSYSDKK